MIQLFFQYKYLYHYQGYYLKNQFQNFIQSYQKLLINKHILSHHLSLLRIFELCHNNNFLT